MTCKQADTPPRTESQTLVKTLPCRNYVADGNNGAIPKAADSQLFQVKAPFDTDQCQSLQ